MGAPALESVLPFLHKLVSLIDRSNARNCP